MDAVVIPSVPLGNWVVLEINVGVSEEIGEGFLLLEFELATNTVVSQNNRTVATDKRLDLIFIKYY
jgi:hypothetical protein